MIEEKLYQLICKTVPLPTVDIALFCGNKVLLVKRGKRPAKDMWWTPGGRQEINETIEESAYRKLGEEVGICAKIIGSVGSVDTIWEERHNVTSVVIATINDKPEVRLNKDHYDYIWIETAYDVELHPYARKIIDTAIVQKCLKGGF
jgi:ADP-ribose pyrophosphatase YjhB (NUDIX family)